MLFEHFALNVPDPHAFADWYVEHLGAAILTRLTEGPLTTFLADASGRVFVEVYRNPAGATDDFSARHPLTFHFAFQTADARALMQRLQAAGAVVVEEQQPGPGTHLVMLRDPWGIPLQLCQRIRPYPTPGA